MTRFFSGNNPAISGTVLCQLLLFLLAMRSLPTISDELNDYLHQPSKYQQTSQSQTGQFVAVPIPVSNPTIGTGLEAALLYLHPQDEQQQASPNSTSGLGLLYTNTDSWLVGLFHDGYYLQDRLRIRAGLGSAQANLDFFGLGSRPVFEDQPIGYSIESDIAMGRILGRIPGSNNWFTGIQILYLDTDVNFDTQELIEGLPYLSSQQQLTTLSWLANYDSRDDNYYPSRGQFAEFMYGKNDQDLASDVDYDRYTLDYSYYIPLPYQSVLAMRANAEQVDGDTPFYLLPHLSMRGFPANRYMDDAAASLHLEWRQKFSARWGYILSLEAGAVGDSITSLDTDDTITSIGAGLRWQVQAEKKLNLGLDVGVTDDDYAIYIRVGEAF